MIKSFFVFIIILIYSLTSFAINSENGNDTSELDTSQIDLFRLHMDRLQLAQKENDPEALIACYSSISQFYTFSGIHEKAKYYKTKQIEQLKELSMDSVLIFHAIIDYEGILFSNNEEIDSKEVYKILDYAIEHQEEVLKDEVLALYRSYLIQNNYLDKLQEFFEKDYPDELLDLKKTHYINYLKIRGLLFEANHNIDSARFYFQVASVEFKKNSNKYLIAKFFIRYGQFLERQNDVKSAIAQYETSLSYANQTGFMPFILESTTRLEELHSEQGDFQVAYNYAKRNIQLKDSLNSMANRDELLRLEITKEDEMRALELEKQEILNQSVLSKAKNRTLISLSIGLFMLILAVALWSRVRYVRRVNVLLKKAKNRAEESERFKQQFLANMSHEIRTPMNAIFGMSNLMLQTDIDDKQKNYLEAIKSSSENLLVIINDVLDLSKLEAGKMELEKIPFNVREQIQIVHDTLKFKAEGKGLTFETEIDKNVPAMVIGDPSRLNQVLINLCGNAIKFTEKGSMGLRIEKEESKDATLRFIVKDSGIGIAIDQVDLLFSAFQQADVSTSRKYGGTGLGLSISKTLVELQDGSISVKSEEGKGSEFTVVIPYEKIDEQSDSNAKTSAKDDKSVLKGIRILVAEDNDFNQIVINDTLEKLIDDVSVDIAGNGKIAIEKLEKNEYDLILMDINMPEMDGHETTRNIRKNMTGNKQNIPIIALTASVLKSEVQKCLDSGMNDFVPKPFSNEELLTAMLKLLGSRPKS